MKKLFPYALSVLLVSCGGSEDSAEGSAEDSSADTTSVDTVSLLPPDYGFDLNDLMSRAENGETETMNFDSTFLEGIEYSEGKWELTGEEAKFLGSMIIEGDLNQWGRWDIEEFAKMDSIEQAGGMDEYMESIDLGMTAYCESWITENVKLNDSSNMLIWVVDQHSYEACPYGWGKTAYGSLFVNGWFRGTSRLAEESGGADPPVWGGTKVSSKIDGTTISVLKEDENCDGEEEIDGEWVELINREEEEYTLEITAEGLVEKK